MSESSKESLAERLTRYRDAAERARKAALSANSDEVRNSYNSIAASWESLIAEAEGAFKDVGKAND